MAPGALLVLPGATVGAAAALVGAAGAEVGAPAEPAAGAEPGEAVDEQATSSGSAEDTAAAHSKRRRVSRGDDGRSAGVEETADMDTSAAPRRSELRAVAGAGYCPIVDMSTFDSWTRAAG